MGSIVRDILFPVRNAADGAVHLYFDRRDLGHEIKGCGMGK